MIEGVFIRCGLQGFLACLRTLTLGFASICLISCSGPPAKHLKVPAEGSAEYSQAVSAFRVGVVAFEVGDDARADARFRELTQLAPGELAGWANWGALALRQGQGDAARERLEQARLISPENAAVRYLIGLMHSREGRDGDALSEWRKAKELEPKNLRITYALALEIERAAGADADQQAFGLLKEILALRPDNLAAQLESIRLAAKRGDTATLKDLVALLQERSGRWPADCVEQFAALNKAVQSGDLRAAGQLTARLRNLLQQVAVFRESYLEIKTPSVAETPPLSRPVKLVLPTVQAAPSDTGLRFAASPITGVARTSTWAGAIALGAEGNPILAFTSENQLLIPSLGKASTIPGVSAVLTPDSVVQMDFNYDFKTDLVLAGTKGIRFLRQADGPSFTDVTAATRLPTSALKGNYQGVWTADIETDGDLDIVLGSFSGDPIVLQNNGDETFTPIRPFQGVSGLRQFAWVDLDGDGTADAAMIDAAGRLHWFTNRRHGAFQPRSLPREIGAVRAMTPGAAENPEQWGLVIVGADGAVKRITDQGLDQPLSLSEWTRLPADLLEAELRVRMADLDNNGVNDLIVARIGAGTPLADGGNVRIWLRDTLGGVAATQLSVSGLAALFDVADIDGDGRLDLVGLDAQGRAAQAINIGTKSYHWQVIRPHAAQAFGDQRINPFGVGGDIEVRAGQLLQKQRIMGPAVHFGLGEQRSVDIVRVLWPNGVLQAEFEPKVDQSVAAEQRLKGSCPFLFAYDGRGINFVKDAVPWGSAIGLRINTIGTARVEATEEWYRIGRDQLVARDGHYDLRITAELWEVYYYDQFGLMTVDHPPGTEIYTDERFAIPAVTPKITVVQTPIPVLRAIDDRGKDVTELVANLDLRSVDSFGRGQYQGVTRDHTLEIELADTDDSAAPLYLIAHGSLRPTDSSINVALSQSGRWRPQGMTLEIPDGKGGWRVAQKNLGFPAGRKKIVLFDLSGLFKPGQAKRVRIRTNLEIFWDQIQSARGRPDAEIRVNRLEPSTADLHYRGYSVLAAPPAGAPEVPDYKNLAGTAPRWRDLIGFYTRYGDVKELLAKADDRYVIMNAGDEMSFRFPEPSPAPAGWLRDFVVTGDGWIKDGDYNSTFSRTVQPLPHHREKAYTTAPGKLEDEYAYRKNASDWATFHTRYVTDTPVLHALRSRSLN